MGFGAVQKILITLLGLNVLVLIVFIESSGKKTKGKIVGVLSSTQRQSAQLFGSILVDDADVGNSNLRDLFYQQLRYAEYDDSGKYKTISNFVLGTDLMQLSLEPLCVGMQTSLDKLHSVSEFVSTWPGPVSIALFAPGPEFFLAISAIKYLRQCYPAIKKQVNWHLVFPVEEPPDAAHLHLARLLSLNCGPDTKMTLQTMWSTLEVLQATEPLARKRSGMKFLYPQNVLRNVARRHCLNEWVVCPDVDMVFPRPDESVQPPLTQQLTKFLRSRQCQDCAFVLPLFELEHENRTLPKDKVELRRYVDKGWARQYHEEIHPPNQAASRLKDWLHKPGREVKVAYEVKYQQWYEPVYIARHSTPRFDERYVGYGMTRNTQVYEMALVGFKFQLLDSIFLSHVWGLQYRAQISKQRYKETMNNLHFFDNVHVRELAARYDSDKFNMLQFQERSPKKYNIEVRTTPKPKPAKKA